LLTITDKDYLFTTISVSRITIPEVLYDPDAAFSKSDPRQIVPIIVVADGEYYKIVDGCKRYKLAKQENRNEISCCILHQQLEPKELALLRIKMNIGRNLSFKEKILIISWLKDNTEKNEYLDLAEECGIPGKAIHDFEALISCDQKLLDAVARGILDITAAPLLSQLKDDDSEAILRFFSENAFSRQMQRELIEWIPEMAFRQKCTVYEVIDSEMISRIRDNTKLNGPQKIQKIRDTVFEKRFPNLARAKEVWQNLSRISNPDPGKIVFQSSEAFEKNRLEVKITLTNSSQAATIFNKLLLISPETWDKLIYPGSLSIKTEGPAGI
jgi:hypothetical protein